MMRATKIKNQNQIQKPAQGNQREVALACPRLCAGILLLGGN